MFGEKKGVNNNLLLLREYAKRPDHLRPCPPFVNQYYCISMPGAVQIGVV